MKTADYSKSNFLRASSTCG